MLEFSRSLTLATLVALAWVSRPAYCVKVRSVRRGKIAERQLKSEKSRKGSPGTPPPPTPPGAPTSGGFRDGPCVNLIPGIPGCQSNAECEEESPTMCCRQHFSERICDDVFEPSLPAEGVRCLCDGGSIPLSPTDDLGGPPSPSASIPPPTPLPPPTPVTPPSPGGGGGDPDLRTGPCDNFDPTVPTSNEGLKDVGPTCASNQVCRDRDGIDSCCRQFTSARFCDNMDSPQFPSLGIRCLCDTGPIP